MKKFREIIEKRKINLSFFSILLFILINAACAKNERVGVDIIKLRVVSVTSEHSDPLTKKEENLWINNVRKFYFDAAHVTLEFENVGKIKVNDFFSEEFDHLPKSPKLEDYRFDFEQGALDVNKEEIIRNLKRVGLGDLKKIFPDKNIRNFEDIYSRAKKIYLYEYGLFNKTIDRRNLKYHSATNWLNILQNTQKYDLIITNETIINDSSDPLSSISMLRGALAHGFAVPGRALISTASLNLIPKEYHDELMQYNLIHKIGHALFNLRHSDPETKSIMSLNPSFEDIKTPKLTEKELDLITANVLMREGDKYYNLRDYSHAIDKYYEALKGDPNCFLCYYKLSQIYCELHDYGSCVSCLESATRLNATWFLPFEILGDIYFKFKSSFKDGLNKAIENYKKAVELESSKIGLRFKLAKCYEETGKNKYAEQEYLAILKIEPTNSVAVHSLEELRNKVDPM